MSSFFRFFVFIVRLPLRYVAFRHFLFLALTLLLSSTLPASAQQLKVMQWNVHGNIGTTTAQSSAGAAAIARVLNYLQPDVILINEVADGTVAVNAAALNQWVSDNLPFMTSGAFYVAVSSESSDVQRNAAISRYPIMSPSTYPDVSTSLRGMHSFQLQLTGTNRLQVFHVHLKCCSDGTSCQTKQDEAQLFSGDISTWAATNSAPYVLAGDLNEDEANPECPSFPTISTLRDGAMLGEFKPTTLSGEYRTWSTSPTAPSIRFDYILAATNRISPASGFVFSTMDWAAHGLYTNSNPQSLSDDSRTASDHYGVVATYNVGTNITDTGQLSVTPSAGLSSSGPVGGPFAPTNQTYTLSNSTANVLNWTATNFANWLTLSASNGSLASGSTTTVAISLNANASTLPAGSYSDVVAFTNTTTGAGNTTRTVGLTVNNGVSSFGFFDDFSTFSAGNLVGQSNWVQLGAASALPLQVSAGRVVIPFGQSVDNQDAYKNFTATNGTVFYGMTLIVSNAPANSAPSYFCALTTSNDGAGFANYRLTAKDNGAGTYALGARITGQSGDPYTFGSLGLAYGSAHVVIVEADSGGTVMKMFVDPTNSNLATQSGYVTNNVGTGTPPTQVGSLVISQFASGTAPNDGVVIGKVVVADNFATAYNDLVGSALTPFQNWQILYFGSTNNPAAAPGADPDGDGQNNLSEFLAGTNPTNAASVFRISSITLEGKDIRVTWTEGAGKTNVLQRSASLSSGFTDLFTVFTAGSVTNYLDAGAATNRTSSYYRVRLAP